MGKHISTILISVFLVGYPMVFGSSFLSSLLNGVGVITEETSAAVTEVREVTITAYSSTPGETDDTPFIAANGTEVHDGMLAANFLPFGKRVQIPSLFGDKIFTVEDRMHPRKKNFVDIWMPSHLQAEKFGIHTAQIVVLD
jgi:3D (Asp-Asp-Asp) domain-containing protein